MKQANQYRKRAQIRSDYSNVEYGEIVCFADHVAVYVGKQGCDCNFVDVRGPGQNARCLNSYGSQTLYKCDY